MNQDVYQKLAHHLDDLPAGYPATDSGVELRILRRLFTPEEAALALHLTLLPEEARVVARRAGLPTPETAQRLQEMETKGLIYSYQRGRGAASTAPPLCGGYLGVPGGAAHPGAYPRF
ncbi:MAG: hypothetical protein M5U34_23525 [Chloroflexi bacterium]|nr:hypothetical protein [Chloroflexota bacterium]